MYIIPNETKQCDVIFCLAETHECAFNHSPQLAPGNLVRLDGPPALKNLNMVDTIPRTPPPPELLHRLDHNQRESFIRLWNTVPPCIRWIEFALDAAGWSPLLSTLSPQHLPLSRTFSRRPNWTTVNVPYVRSKSRYLQGLSRFNRAPTDLTQSSPDRQTPFWTPISRLVLFSTPRRRGRAPSCASQNNRVASESQSTTKN